MVTQYDEKGKIFTQVVQKQPVTVLVRTTHNQVRGSLHVRPQARLKDELNGDRERYIAITDAVIYALTGEELYRTSFLVVNQDHIEWIIPEEEINQ